MVRKCSNHCVTDRIDRLTFIATTVGFGNILEKRYQPENDTWANVTDTGVVIITSNKNTDYVVTAFIATKSKIAWIYNEKTIPSYLKNRINKNYKQGLIQKQDEKFKKRG